MRRSLLVLLLLSPSLWAATPITQAQLQAMTPKPLVIDLRAPTAYAEGHIPGAINIPDTEILKRLGKLEQYRHRPVVVYCRTGRRAALVINTLESRGFSQVHHLQGDWQGWQEAKQPEAH
ncbi:rhodanese-like domain-containing protein [Gallaecimonas sp. GXIMD1310]|uniref:rhodanese-like domain-containing protein n=1 Tax=Gallaecimonas sp. GXIMD1310 TaxID=3131926 RepID=UPI0032531090